MDGNLAAGLPGACTADRHGRRPRAAGKRRAAAAFKGAHEHVAFIKHLRKVHVRFAREQLRHPFDDLAVFLPVKPKHIVHKHDRVRHAEEDR